MPKKVRTARGKLIDFDLLKIKEQIASTPKPTNVVAREDFIDKKLRRRVKRIKKNEEVTAVEEEKLEQVVEEVVEKNIEDKKEATNVDTDS